MVLFSLVKLLEGCVPKVATSSAPTEEAGLRGRSQQAESHRQEMASEPQQPGSS